LLLSELTSSKKKTKRHPAPCIILCPKLKELLITKIERSKTTKNSLSIGHSKTFVWCHLDFEDPSFIQGFPPFFQHFPAAFWRRLGYIATWPLRGSPSSGSWTATMASRRSLHALHMRVRLGIRLHQWCGNGCNMFRSKMFKSQMIDVGWEDKSMQSSYKSQSLGFQIPSASCCAQKKHPFGTIQLKIVSGIWLRSQLQPDISLTNHWDIWPTIGTILYNWDISSVTTHLRIWPHGFVWQQAAFIIIFIFAQFPLWKEAISGVYVCIYIHTCIHAYMHTCIHAYIHTYIHIYIYIYVYIYGPAFQPPSAMVMGQP